METTIARKKFTTEEYHMLGDAGVIKPDERVELINGEIIEMSPVNAPHIACVNRLNMLFASKLSGQAIVSIQNPVVLDNYNEPQPDLVLFRHQDDFYAENKATSKDVILVIEVADTTLGYDRNVKSDLYAEAGISEFWIVNIQKNEIEKYTQPEDGRFQRLVTMKKEDTIHVEALDFSVVVSNIVG